MSTANLVERQIGVVGYDAGPFDINGWNGSSHGPFEHGAFRYLVYARRSTVSPFTLAVARTSDGSTFTVLDTAHAPSLTTLLSTDVGAVVQVGSVLWIAYYDPGDTVNLVSFDMVTGLYGTIFTGPSPAKPFAIHQVAALSSGGFVILIGATPAFTAGFYFVTVTAGGVFGALTALALNNAFYDRTAMATLSAVADNAGRVHGIYNLQTGANTWELHYFRISGGAVVADTLLTTGANPWAEDASPNGVGVYIAATDKVAFPVMDVNSAQLFNVVFVAAASTAPVVSMEAVAAGNLALSNSPSFTVDGTGANYIFSYLLYNLPIATQEQIATYKRPASGGAWTVGPVVYNSAVNAPNPAPAFLTQLAPMNLRLLSSGLYGTVLGFGFSVSSTDVLYYGEFALEVAVDVGQLLFYGVKRKTHGQSDPKDVPYRYYEKPWDIPFQFTITGNAVAGGILAQAYTHYESQIKDFDFELRQITKSVVDANNAAVNQPSPFAIWLYDEDKVTRSSLPVLAEFLCDDPSTGGIGGREFWPSPPILYRINRVIGFDAFTTLGAGSGAALPVTVNLLFRGIRRIPCL